MRRSPLAWLAALALAAGGVVLVVLPARARVACGPGFTAVGARCMPGLSCPAPLAKGALSCEALGRVLVPKTHVTVGPSDWEAEGRVAPRNVDAGPFWVDAFEATVAALRPGDDASANDALRAASGLTRGEAAAYCAARAGRLPTEDEWIAAAAGLGGHRYPWGETGAVCRRAAFGLAKGPCSEQGTGPDTVGAHPDGDSTRGVHDLAGNVAEWVAPGVDERVGVAKGGSWRSELAAELRVWARLELDPTAHDDRVGVRCAYDAP